MCIGAWLYPFNNKYHRIRAHGIQVVYDRPLQIKRLIENIDKYSGKRRSDERFYPISLPRIINAGTNNAKLITTFNVAGVNESSLLVINDMALMPPSNSPPSKTKSTVLN